MACFTYHRAAVSAGFRADLRRLVPALGDDPRRWGLASLLLFPAAIDEETRGVIVAQELVWAAVGDVGHRTPAIEYLDDFSANVWSLDIAEHVFEQSSQNRCRRVTAQAWPEGVAELVAAELRSGLPAAPVFLDDGASVKVAAPRQIRDALQREADAVRDDHYHEDGRPKSLGDQRAFTLLNYMNGMPPNRFAKLRSHLPEARAVADKLTKGRLAQLTLLRAIDMQPKPFYMPTARTSRLSGLNPSVLGLQANVRETLTAEWVKADLEKCQLAVMAATWGKGAVNMADYRDGGLWADLAGHVGVKLTANSKRIIKTGLYALLYGRGDEASADAWAEALPDVPDAYRRFVAHPLIGPLLAARKAEFARLRAARQGVDVFGNIVLPSRGADGRPNYASVMAICAQSYELALLYPAVSLAIDNRGTHGFSIVLWLHDGFSFVAHDKRDTDMWTRRLRYEVDAQCRRLGIPTFLCCA